MLGPEGCSRQLMSVGRAVGSLMSDPLFCQLTAYKAQQSRDLVAGLDSYITELTVMPPSWDQNIRLDPPKTSQPIQARLEARAAGKERRKREKDDANDQDEEEGDEDRDDLTLFNVKKHEEKDHTEDDSLQFTGRPFGGLIADVKRKLPWFVSDFKDAMHIQTLASIIYIYLGKQLFYLQICITSHIICSHCHQGNNFRGISGRHH